MQLRGVNKHWRDCLQAREELLNPRTFVDLDCGTHEQIHLTMDSLIRTISNSGWLCTRVRTIQEPPDMGGALLLGEFPNLCELRIKAEALFAVPQEAGDRLTKLTVDVCHGDCPPDEKESFPSMCKLQSLELCIGGNLDLFGYDLSNLAKALPSLVSLGIDCYGKMPPVASPETPFSSLRKLRCHSDDIRSVHLAGKFVSELHLTGTDGDPVTVLCNLVVMNGIHCAMKWRDTMPVTEPKELRLEGAFMRQWMHLLLKTGIPLITINVERHNFLPAADVWALVDAIEQDVVVRFIFPDGSAPVVYKRSPVDRRWLKRVH
jgi:hypothetical protein